MLQSKAFQPHLNRWAELLIAEGGHGAKVDPHDVPSEILQNAQSSSAEVRCGNAESRFGNACFCVEESLSLNTFPFCHKIWADHGKPCH